MKKLNKCSFSMAVYLWHKWNNHDISQSQIENLFTVDAFCDIFGGWFYDFHVNNFILEV